MPNLIGQTLGRYHILEQLGEGGMAIVYKAYDTRLERDVAIKVIRTDQFAPVVLERILKRFEREAKALARLSHPNIVKVHDYGEYKVTPYLVLEYLPAGTLKQRLGKPIPWQEAVQLIIPIAQALEYAHEHNIVHRDIKPSNILLTEKGQPMLTDFGIAKLLENEDTAILTSTGLSVGTPEYMSPEQSMGKDVDGRADIYSLGIILYEMITGRKPYVGDTPMSVIIKQISEPLPSPRIYVSGLPDNIEKILAMSLAKSPDERYSTASEFAEALERVQAKSVRTPLSQRTKPTKRLVDEPKTTSTQMDDEVTVDQFENTDKIKVSATRKNSRKPDTNQTRLTLLLSDTVYIATEGGIPLYTSFSETQWNIWLEYGEKLTIVESLENARDNMGKYGHYIQVIDKHGNKGFVPARTIGFENPIKRKIK